MLSYNYLTTSPIESARLKSLLQRWDSLREDFSLPLAGRLNRPDLGENFDYMSRLEVHNSHYIPRFLVAEQGRAMAEMYGDNCPGHFIDEVLPVYKRAAANESYLKCIERKAPIYTVWKFLDANGNAVREERLLLPFGDTSFGVTQYWLGVELHSEAKRNLWFAWKRPTQPKFIVKAAIEPVPAS